MASNETSLLLLPNAAEPTSPLVVVSLSHILKLTSTNYIAWKIQIEATLLGLDLHGYIDGTIVAPPQQIQPPTTTTATQSDPSKPAADPSQPIANPKYSTWFRQDKLLLSAIAGTITPSLVPLISQASTSCDAWRILAKTYANPTRGHLKQLKDRLRSITKGPKSVSDYMQELKLCADQLASLGRPLDADDLIDRVLDQLNDPEFDPVVQAVQGRENPISFDELHEKLINRELSIKHKSTATSSFPATVNYTSKNPPRQPNNRNPHPNPSVPQNPTFSNQPTNNSPRPNLTYKGRCQWCRNIGHYMSQCHSFRQQFPNVTFPTPPSNPNFSPRPSSRQPQYQQPTAYSSSIHSSTPQPWLMDSGASHHSTNDLTTLALHSPYNGTEELLIGDGTGLSFQNTGSSSISTPTFNFKLNNVLHVPSLSRNILSVSQFCHDNNASITFLSNSFLVKDLRTGAILHQGHTKSGIYEWLPSSPTLHSAALSSTSN